MKQMRQVLGDRYELHDVLGVGGMAVVWRAQDRVLGRQVAVKVLSARYAADPSSRERIRLEARAAAGLSHPNVAQVYDFGETEAGGQCIPFVVMELVAGQTLQECVAAEPLPPKAMLRLGAEVAAALAAAHADGVVHRDIKPANIMVTPTGAKVVDFGIAAAVNSDGPVDPGGVLFGTPAYLAPERLTGDAIEPASDVYALGVLLYRQLAGRMPWNTAEMADILEAHLHIDPAPLPASPDVPAAVIELCRACLAKDPAARPTAREAAIVLAEAAGVAAVSDLSLVAALPGGKTNAVLIPGRPAAAVRRRRVRMFAAAAGVAVVAVLAWPLVPLGSDGDEGSRSQAAPPGAGPLHPSPSTSPSSGQPSGSTPDGPRTATTLPAQVPGTGPAATRDPPPATGTTRPTATAGPTTAPPPPPPPPPVTFTSSAGTLSATCTNTNLATLVSWSPTKPFKTKDVQVGPASQAALTLKHGNSIVTMTVTCTGGEPSETTTSSEKQNK